jgi:DNA-binding XRE family transcriptional regulator
MIIGERLRIYREQKNLSQGDIEKRTGLLRCYISRVENGHTVPAVETLEKLARALDMPLYQLLYDGEEPPSADVLPSRTASDAGWGSAGKDQRFLRKLRHLLGKMQEQDRELLLFTAQQMARRKKQPQQPAEKQAEKQSPPQEPVASAAAAAAGSGSGSGSN